MNNGKSSQVSAQAQCLFAPLFTGWKHFLDGIVEASLCTGLGRITDQSVNPSLVFNAHAFLCLTPQVHK